MLVGGIFFDLLGDTKHFRNIRVGPKIQQPLHKSSSLYKAETANEGRLKVILLLQVRSHDLEPTFFFIGSHL